MEERAWQQIQSMLSRDGWSTGPRPHAPATAGSNGPISACRYLGGDEPELENSAVPLVSMLAGTPRITRLLALAVKFTG